MLSENSAQVGILDFRYAKHPSLAVCSMPEHLQAATRCVAGLPCFTSWLIPILPARWLLGLAVVANEPVAQVSDPQYLTVSHCWGNMPRRGRDGADDVAVYVGDGGAAAHAHGGVELASHLLMATDCVRESRLCLVDPWFFPGWGRAACLIYRLWVEQLLEPLRACGGAGALAVPCENVL